MPEIIIETTPKEVFMRVELPDDLRDFMNNRTFTVGSKKITALTIPTIGRYVPELRGIEWFLPPNESSKTLEVSAEKHTFLLAVLQEAKRQWLSEASPESPTKRVRTVL